MIKLKRSKMQVKLLKQDSTALFEGVWYLYNYIQRIIAASTILYDVMGASLSR